MERMTSSPKRQNTYTNYWMLKDKVTTASAKILA